MAHQVTAGPTGPTGGSRRRRPVGEPPPLPRDLRGSTPILVAAFLVIALLLLWGRQTSAPGRFQGWFDRGVEGRLPDLSAGGFASFGRGFATGPGLWSLIVVRWGTVVALIVWKRWRHLAVFVGSVALVTVAVQRVVNTAQIAGVPRQPAFAAASLAVTLAGVVYGLVPAGRRRWFAKIVSAAICLVVAVVSILIRANTPGELVVGFVIGFTIPIVGFRVLAPNAAFPVTYRSGRTAHLDVDGPRGAVIETALREQLVLDVADVSPFGLSGSGGSTPLRVTLADGRHLFAKLCAVNHLRADRWCKLGRTVLYGSLEDERSFDSVRRMIEYEDHMLRYLRDNGVRTAEPYGFAEITPEHEYLLVTGFIEDAREILDVPIDDDIIASGIGLVRGLWDAGIAHRDIKPANLLVRGHDVFLIDAFFCQMRPSAWRQSVDLANMLMLLALGSDVNTVYRAALMDFTPDDIAEAFAATRCVTVPTQLRDLVHHDERSLAKESSVRAPARERISIQRWTPRRIGLTAALLAVAAVGLMTTLLNLHTAGFTP